MKDLRRVLFINVVARTVMAVLVKDMADMLALVGGPLEKAATLGNGDEVFVNDEAIFRKPQFFFSIKSRDSLPYAGNAFLIGTPDVNGQHTWAKSEINEIERDIVFHTLEEAQSIGLALSRQVEELES